MCFVQKVHGSDDERYEEEVNSTAIANTTSALAYDFLRLASTELSRKLKSEIALPRLFYTYEDLTTEIGRVSTAVLQPTYVSVLEAADENNKNIQIDT